MLPHKFHVENIILQQVSGVWQWYHASRRHLRYRYHCEARWTPCPQGSNHLAFGILDHLARMLPLLGTGRWLMFHSKCREIHDTWILWDCLSPSWELTYGPPSKLLLCLSNEDWFGGFPSLATVFWRVWCLGCRFPIRLRLWRSKTCHSSVKSHKLPGPLSKCSILYNEFNSHDPPLSFFNFWRWSPSWEHFPLPGHNFPFMGLHGHIFPFLGLHGHIFPFMGTSSPSWAQLPLHGPSWAHLPLHGHIFGGLAVRPRLIWWQPGVARGVARYR